MKPFWIFLSIQIAFSTQKLSKIQNDWILSTAISDVIYELFTRHDLQFKTIIYGKVSPHIFDVINGLGSNGLFTHLSTSSNTPETSNQYRVLYESTLVFCESLEEIKKFFRFHSLGGNDFARHIKFLFYTTEPFNVSQIGVKKANNDRGDISWFSYFLNKQKGSLGQNIKT